MFAGLGSLVAALAQFLPPLAPPSDAAEAADQLAVTVREQWSEEVEARQLRDPAVIPLSWAGTGRPVSVPAESVVGPHAGRVRRLSLDGRLEGSFDHAASQLAAGFRQVPSGRLVVLGEPGSGKTVLAIMLTLGLLADRTPGTPVPVMLSVSGWDPVMESLDDFIVGSLATSYYGGHPQIPRHLLERRLLLPVLDGLDEMPEPARRNAVRGLNDACGDGRGVVVTCRSVEYQDVIEGGSPLLRRAPVVEVAPVPVSDIIAYLTDVNWPQGVDWEPVYTHLRRHPDSPAATALSTPLALSLARGVYRNCDRDPRELLGFESRHAIEDHLVDHTIRAAYAPPPGTLPLEADSEWEEDAQKAEKWLTFLATYLHQHRERDLAWWLMSSRLLSRWSGLLIGIATGVAVMLLILLYRAVDAGLGENLGPKEIIWTGGAVAVLTMLTWYAAPDPRPGRVSFTLRGSLHRLRGGFRTGLALAFLVAATALGISGVITTFSGTWYLPKKILAYDLIALSIGASIAIGLAFAAHNWLNTSPERSTRTDPQQMIKQDRQATLVTAGLSGIALAISALPLMIMAHKAKNVALLASLNLSGMPPIIDIMKQPANAFGIENEHLVIIATSLLPGLAFAILMLFPRAWTRFTLLRLTLSAKGQLPWNLAQFLDDARNRQLLRQSGGLYQFRHIRLQERLATHSLAQNRALTPNPHTVRRRRLQITATATALAATTLLANQTLLPEDTSDIVILTGDVISLALGPSDEHTLVTMEGKGTVRRWDTRTGAGTSVEQHKEGSDVGYFLKTSSEGAHLFHSGGLASSPKIKVATIPWDKTEAISWKDEPIDNEELKRYQEPQSGEHYDPPNLLPTSCLPPSDWHDRSEPVTVKRTLQGSTLILQGMALYFSKDESCKNGVQSIISNDTIEDIVFNEEEDAMAVAVASGETRIYSLRQSKE